MEKEQQKKKYAAIIVAVIILLLLILLLLLLFMKKEYKITFDSNGGSEVAAVTVKENDKLEKPEDPTREGYTFGGWYYNEELYDFELPVKQDMTLEAGWAVEGAATTPVSGVSLSVTSLKLTEGGEDALVAVVEPENATNQKLIWTTSDASIVTVDENGNVKALKAGTVTVTVTTEDGSYTATCEITVEKKQEEEGKKEVAVTGVKISGATTVTVGSSIRLTATVSPSNATNKSVTWSSSNKAVATVDRYGNVKGIKAGTVTITVRTSNGRTASYKVTVKAKQTSNTKPGTVKVTSVKISGAKDLTVGQSLKLTATVSPSNASNKKVTWKSSNPSVATVDGNGNVKAVSAGTVTITVTTADGAKTASVTITVKETYSYKWVEIKESSADQYMLYIVNSKGQYVSGTATLTSIGGTSKTVSIPASGAMFVRSTIKSVSNVKGN